MKRREAREYAMKALFQIDLVDCDADFALQNIFDEEIIKSDSFLDELVYGYVNNRVEIDNLIVSNLANWKLERMGTVDRAILRVAVCEMTQMDDIPLNVTMNEAIEIAKVYGDDESKKFINAVLSKVKEAIN